MAAFESNPGPLYFTEGEDGKLSGPLKKPKADQPEYGYTYKTKKFFLVSAETTIKGQSFEDWEKWLRNELTPPVQVEDEQKYVLEAFLELIEKTKKQA